MILFKAWVISEFGIVFMHEFFIVLLILPMIALVLYSESEYSKYSLADPK